MTFINIHGVLGLIEQILKLELALYPKIGFSNKFVVFALVFE